MKKSEVVKAVKRIRRKYRYSAWNAWYEFNETRSEIFGRFGSTDVEQALRNDAITAAADSYNEKLLAAQNTRQQQLDVLRSHAGQWADLVPSH